MKKQLKIWEGFWTWWQEVDEINTCLGKWNTGVLEEQLIYPIKVDTTNKMEKKTLCKSDSVQAPDA